MRIYVLLFFITSILFQSQAQTKKPTQLPGYPGDENIGTLVTIEDEGGIVKVKIPDSVYVYTYTQVMPAFPGGGDTAFNSFIKKYLIYPEDAKNKNIIGSLFIQFIVEVDGSLSSICIVPSRGLSPSCDQAAIAVLSISPCWTPGQQNGIPVRVKCVKRIKFPSS